jgi:hypothetical protein
MPDGVTLWVECKRPTGGHRTKLQENRIAKLLELGHFAFFVKTKSEVDMILDAPKVFYRGGKLAVGGILKPSGLWASTPKGLVPW